MGREGRGVDRWSTWEGSAKTLEVLPLTMLILGGWSTVNLGRICEDFGRITSGDQQSTVEGSTKTLEGLPLTMLTVNQPPPPGSTLSEVILCLHGSFQSWLLIDPPPLPSLPTYKVLPSCRCALWIYHNALWVILHLVPDKLLWTVLWPLFCKIRHIWTLNNKYQVSVHILVRNKYSKNVFEPACMKQQKSS